MKAPIPALCLAVAALLPSAAVAQESAAGDVAEKLKDPLTQYAAAGVLSAMSKAVLEMRVEPFAKAMERIAGRAAPDLPSDATVADLVGTSHAEVREELINRVPRTMEAMGDMAGSVDEMIPEIEAMAKKMKDAVPRY